MFFHRCFVNPEMFSLGLGIASIVNCSWAFLRPRWPRAALIIWLPFPVISCLILLFGWVGFSSQEPLPDSKLAALICVLLAATEAIIYLIFELCRLRPYPKTLVHDVTAFFLRAPTDQGRIYRSLLLLWLPFFLLVPLLMLTSLLTGLAIVDGTEGSICFQGTILTISSLIAVGWLYISTFGVIRSLYVLMR